MPQAAFRPAPRPAPPAERHDFVGDEARAILGAVPHWTVRSLQGALLALLLCALVITWFIHYPDEITAPVRLAARHAPASVVARRPGYLVLRAGDGQRVGEGEVLGYVAGSANADAVLALEGQLARFRAAFYAGTARPFDFAPFAGARLGDVQDAYNEFARSVQAYELWSAQRGLAERRGELAREVESYRVLIARSEAADSLGRQEAAAAAARFRIDSALAVRELTSPAEFQERRSAYLAGQRERLGAGATLASERIAVAELEQRLHDAERDEQKQAAELAGAVDAAIRRLDAVIGGWDQEAVLRAPMAGRVALFTFWTDHQYVKPGDEVLSVVADDRAFFAVAEAPVQGSGKITTGQRVRIRLADYPAEEYGDVNGVVQRISLLPRENVYRIAIALPDGLTSVTGRRLAGRQEMSGTAVIVTDDLRLLERLFFQVRLLLDA